MRNRGVVALLVAVVGVFVSWAGQGVWGHSPDELWAAIGVVSLLSSIAIAAERRISQALQPVTVRRRRR